MSNNLSTQNLEVLSKAEVSDAINITYNVGTDIEINETVIYYGFKEEFNGRKNVHVFKSSSHPLPFGHSEDFIKQQENHIKFKLIPQD